MTLNALIIYICSVNFICADVTAMLFRSAIILTVWQATSCSEFNTFNVKLSVITVCFPVIFKLSWPRNVLKIVCAIDRLRIWKHCLTTMCLSSGCLVSSVSCLTLYKAVCLCVAPPYPQNSYLNPFLILINFS